MSILVTGGAGYIGTHICIELMNSGYEVVVIDNFSTSKPEALKWVTNITGNPYKVYNLDLTNRGKLSQVFANESIDSVIHLAGYKSVNESTNYPMKYYANNITGTTTLCEVMQQFKVKNLVFSSSATVYAPSNQLGPIPESHPLGPTNPYGHTKQMIEEILRNLYKSDPTWNIGILRYFNPVGAHESGHIGEDPIGIPNNLLPYITKVAVGKLPTLFIYGDDYPTRDGTGVRDYIHVVDLATGHLSALKWVESSRGIETFNLGTGKGYSVLEMVRTFERASGKKIPYEIVPRRPGDIAVCYADVTKARDVLGWEAKRDINDICRDAWRWQKTNPNGYEATSSLINEDEVVVND